MKKVLMIVLMIVSMVFVSGCKAKGDEVDQEVDRVISDFLTSYRSFYVTEDGVSTDVLLALHHLDPKHKKAISILKSEHQWIAIIVRFIP